MKIRRFFGKDMRDALAQVKTELGGEAVIMSNKKVGDGIEIVAAYDREPSPSLMPKPSPAGKKSPSLSDIIGDSGPDSLRALLEQQSKAAASAQAEPSQPAAQDSRGSVSTPSSAPASTPAQQRPAAAAPQSASSTPVAASQQASSTSDKDLQDIRQELASLRNVLQFQVSGLIEQDRRRAHPLHNYLAGRLEQMGIEPALADEVVSYTPEACDERQAWVYLLKLLANRIHTTGDSILNAQGVVALVGPTGTGKTTTVAKLAARYAQKYGQDQVALVTIDSYRIAAFEQLATYGKIIGCAVKKAHNEQELADVLYQLRNKRLVLIDSAGFGQRDSRLIKQLDTLRTHSCASIKKYLVMQANSQYQVMERTINTYNQISLQGCIFTKLDECYSLGEAVSAAISHRLPVSYLTNGQQVPEDLHVADAKYLITTAAKLYKKYALAHTANQAEAKRAHAV
ncbi:flagellar biosynthesis protein FlhF [Aestuariibacter halophilus]|uniref:Flagellar biosynthesis protein FlhF n=1 Tax=Fluctibacter halophilus TaxID=226011 RepID=A0ABS8G2G5_9ALTE|nr:flagellar biosynthesis protein FlhF [Aestuariibacter halophilus]MCC2614765.1 flagellar biosynthesis protein FlhF [Aestuariibacter halophilus]